MKNEHRLKLIDVHAHKCECVTPGADRLQWHIDRNCEKLREKLLKTFCKSKVRKVELRRLNRMLEFYGYKFREWMDEKSKDAAAMRLLRQRIDNLENSLANRQQPLKPPIINVTKGL